jgi:hypothetical protein
MHPIIKSYLKAFIYAFILTISAYSLSFLVKKLHITTNLLDLIQITGIVFIFSAGYGKLGWKHQTWGGKSKIENLDTLIFNIFSILGYFLSILPYFLK